MDANKKLAIKNKSEKIGWLDKITANEFITIAKEITYKRIKVLLDSGKALKTKKVSIQKL